jgi:nitrous oxide reductase accessory protein NosL
MKGKTLLMILVACTIAILVTTTSFAQQGQKWCPLCGMNLKMFQKTNHSLTFKDGTQRGYCSLHCAAIVHKKMKDQIAKVEVADFVSGNLIVAERAYYLVGSDLPGVMTVVSKKAFASEEVAKKYQNDHGGKIVMFEEALRLAQADLPSDMKMLKEKKIPKMIKMGKKVAETKGCFTCHGAEGKGGGKGPAWTSPAFAKKMNTKVKIKEAVLSGKGEMPSFEGKITEKELQALMLYIWSLRTEQ